MNVPVHGSSVAAVAPAPPSPSRELPPHSREWLSPRPGAIRSESSPSIHASGGKAAPITLCWLWKVFLPLHFSRVCLMF